MFAKAYIEITSFCGLKCDFCTPKKKSVEVIKIDVFENILKQLQNKTKIVAFHILGDPLSVKNITGYLDLAHAYDHKVELTTSGFYTEHLREDTLFHSAIKQINFSLSAFWANKATADRSLETYLSTIIEFAQKSAERPKRFVNLRLWNIGDERYAELNASVERALSKHFGVLSFNTKKIKLAPFTILHKDTVFSWPSINGKQYGDFGKCYAITGQIGFLSDGSVVPCCLDSDGVMRLGNINKNNLDEILESNKAISIKTGFESGVCVEDFCKTCGFIRSRL